VSTAAATNAPARRFRWYHGVLVIVLALIALMWIYAFFVASSANLNRVADKAWAARNEQLCASAKAKIDALPPARTAKTPIERANVLDQANGYVADLIDLLKANKISGSTRDGHLVQLWLADWDLYLSNRRDYAAVLHKNLDRAFAVSLRDGTPITERLDGFADINNMVSCETPGDV
jgi:hypothetical protein